ncbi:unnamed protein product, partial [Laminaria digitata]
ITNIRTRFEDRRDSSNTTPTPLPHEGTKPPERMLEKEKDRKPTPQELEQKNQNNRQVSKLPPQPERWRAGRKRIFGNGRIQATTTTHISIEGGGGEAEI